MDVLAPDSLRLSTLAAAVPTAEAVRGEAALAAEEAADAAEEPFQHVAAKVHETCWDAGAGLWAPGPEAPRDAPLTLYRCLSAPRGAYALFLRAHELLECLTHRLASRSMEELAEMLEPFKKLPGPIYCLLVNSASGGLDGMLIVPRFSRLGGAPLSPPGLVDLAATLSPIGMDRCATTEETCAYAVPGEGGMPPAVSQVVKLPAGEPVVLKFPRPADVGPLKRVWVSSTTPVRMMLADQYDEEIFAEKSRAFRAGGSVGELGEIVYTEYPKLFEHADRAGEAREIRGDDRDLVGPGWNDRASSATVPEGWRLLVYEHTNFEGASLTLEAGEHNMIGAAPPAEEIPMPEIRTRNHAQKLLLMRRWLIARARAASAAQGDWNDRVSSARAVRANNEEIVILRADTGGVAFLCFEYGDPSAGTAGLVSVAVVNGTNEEFGPGLDEELTASSRFALTFEDAEPSAVVVKDAAGRALKLAARYPRYREYVGAAREIAVTFPRPVDTTVSLLATIRGVSLRTGAALQGSGRRWWRRERYDMAGRDVPGPGGGATLPPASRLWYVSGRRATGEEVRRLPAGLSVQDAVIAARLEGADLIVASAEDTTLLRSSGTPATPAPCTPGPSCQERHGLGPWRMRDGWVIPFKILKFTASLDEAMAVPGVDTVYHGAKKSGEAIFSAVQYDPDGENAKMSNFPPQGVADPQVIRMYTRIRSIPGLSPTSGSPAPPSKATASGPGELADAATTSYRIAPPDADLAGEGWRELPETSNVRADAGTPSTEWFRVAEGPALRGVEIERVAVEGGSRGVAAAMQRAREVAADVVAVPPGGGEASLLMWDPEGSREIPAGHELYYGFVGPYGAEMFSYHRYFATLADALARADAEGLGLVIRQRGTDMYWLKERIRDGPNGRDGPHDNVDTYVRGVPQSELTGFAPLGVEYHPEVAKELELTSGVAVSGSATYRLRVGAMGLSVVDGAAREGFSGGPRRLAALTSADALRPGDAITSADESVRVVLQEDRSLAVFRGALAVWRAPAGDAVEMSADGELVAGSRSVSGGARGAILVASGGGDGGAVLLSDRGTVRWSAPAGCRRPSRWELAALRARVRR